MRLKRPLVLATASLLALPALVSAQSQPAQYISVLTVTAKPSGTADYEDYVKKIVAGAAKAGASQRTFGYTIGSGGPGYTYIFVTPFKNWAEQGAFTSVRDILVKAYGEVEAARLMKAGRANVERSESAVYGLLDGLSTKPKAMDPPPAHLQIFRTEVKPEMIPDWELFLAKLKAAAEQAPEAPTAIRRTAVEGQAGVYVTSQGYMTGAERDAWPSLMDVLKKAYGEKEAQAINEMRLRSVKRAEFFILNYRPDLSTSSAAK